jgi:hypothetical protein
MDTAMEWYVGACSVGDGVAGLLRDDRGRVVVETTVEALRCRLDGEHHIYSFAGEGLDLVEGQWIEAPGPEWLDLTENQRQLLREETLLISPNTGPRRDPSMRLCEQCGYEARNAHEAQEHADYTGHMAFSFPDGTACPF